MTRWIAGGVGVLVLCSALCALTGCGGERPVQAADPAPPADPAAVARPTRAADPVLAAAAGSAVDADPAGDRADEPAPEAADAEEDGEPVWRPAVDPKPLSDEVKRGLVWLVRHQNDDSGWGQGEESRHMGRSLDRFRDSSNVADTCAAVLALMRSGSDPSEGPHARNIRRGLDYICTHIEKSDDESLYVTSARGTRLQMKLGTYIDTFLASMVLAELRGRMPAEKGNERVLVALDKVMTKIEKNQKTDGTFGGQGWANSLSVAMASKGMNRARQAGYKVDEGVRAKLEANGRKQFDRASGKFAAGRSAGVDLYASAASLSQMQDSANTNFQMTGELKWTAVNAPAPAEREAAAETLKRFDDNEKDMEAAQRAVVAKLADKRFIAGFGSNGGEEFLSYVNIGESLVVKGGEVWQKWDAQITANLNRIQNEDGSWTGHHCITGRTFCTSAALLVLMTDRAPVPVASKIRRR